jgi:hypothetical protein
MEDTNSGMLRVHKQLSFEPLNAEPIICSWGNPPCSAEFDEVTYIGLRVELFRWRKAWTVINLEPLAEVERALLVVQVLHAPHPELLGLLLGILGEHLSCKKFNSEK